MYMYIHTYTYIYIGNHLISDALALGLVEMATPFWRPVLPTPNP